MCRTHLLIRSAIEDVKGTSHGVGMLRPQAQLLRLLLRDRIYALPRSGDTPSFWKVFKSNAMPMRPYKGSAREEC
eukprot:5975758-Amphidinium_carterae.1